MRVLSLLAICVIQLSDFRAGSTALQGEFVRAGAKRLSLTKHRLGETLYWAKATALLQLPQGNLRYSKAIPYATQTARRELLRMLEQNLPDETFAELSKLPGAEGSDRIVQEELVFSGWKALCEAHGPVFFEKSPHHLHQQSSLKLMLQARERLPEISFRFIGLVRNPLDTLYSMWSRWRYVPELQESEWIRAYKNLRWFQQQAGDSLKIVRYEDLTADADCLAELLDFCGLPGENVDSQLHQEAREKWRDDKFFGFQPAQQTLDLARSYGYRADALRNERHPLWLPYRTWHRALRTGRERLAQLRGRGRKPANSELSTEAESKELVGQR